MNSKLRTTFALTSSMALCGAAMAATMAATQPHFSKTETESTMAFSEIKANKATTIHTKKARRHKLAAAHHRAAARRSRQDSNASTKIVAWQFGGQVDQKIAELIFYPFRYCVEPAPNLTIFQTYRRALYTQYQHLNQDSAFHCA